MLPQADAIMVLMDQKEGFHMPLAEQTQKEGFMRLVG